MSTNFVNVKFRTNIYAIPVHFCYFKSSNNDNGNEISVPQSSAIHWMAEQLQATEGLSSMKLFWS
jgi:hypothetical protein